MYADIKSCQYNDIEDEYYFILICPIYDYMRKKYINGKYFVRPFVYKLCQLLQEIENHVLRNLAKYIVEAMSLRENKLHQ